LSTCQNRNSRPVPKNRRRWFQFGLRTGLVIVTAIAIALAWHTANVNRQRAAIARVTDLGGHVTYDYQRKPLGVGTSFYAEVQDAQVSALASWLGTDHVHNLVAVDFMRVKKTAMTVNDLQLIAQVRSVECVQFPQVASADPFHHPKTTVTDEMFQALRPLPRLRELNLHSTTLDDRQLIQFVVCHRNLWLLQLANTAISDVGVERLGALTELEWMDLSATHVTDAGLDQLHSLKKMRWLVLISTDVTPEGVGRLRTALPSATIVYP
jgi:hypothetical protein